MIQMIEHAIKHSTVLEEARSCCVCDATLVPRFERVVDPQSLETFAIKVCPSCGLGHTTPQPANLGDYYGKAYYGNRHSFTKRLCMRRRVQLLDQATQAAGDPRGALLDIGCGDGSFLREAQSHGWSPTGTELGGNPARTLEGDIPLFAEVSEAAQRRRYDAVTMWHSLEHFRNVRKAIADARRALRPGGALIVAVPDAGGLQARLFGPQWFHLDVPRHLFHFTRTALAQLLEKEGLTVESWGHQEAELDVFGWMQSALNSVLPVPNVLFNELTGKPTGASLWARAASYAMGSCAFPISVGATAASAALGRGGTLIAVARAA